MAPIGLSHHSESNDVQHDPLWPDLTSNCSSNFDLDLLRSNWVSFDSSQRKEHNGDIVEIVAIDQKLVKENVCAKIWCLTSLNFDLWRRNSWPEVKSESTLQIDRVIAHLLLLPLAFISCSCLSFRNFSIFKCTYFLCFLAHLYSDSLFGYNHRIWKRKVATACRYKGFI